MADAIANGTRIARLWCGLTISVEDLRARVSEAEVNPFSEDNEEDASREV